MQWLKIDNNILSFSAKTKTLNQVEDGNFRLNTRFLDPHPATSPPTNQKKVTHPAAHTPHFAYKNSLKTFGGFGSFFEQEPRILLKTFLAPDARISICLASLCSAESLLRCFRREHPFQGSKVGSCLTLRSELSKETWIVQGDMCADKATDFIRKGRPGGEQEGQGTWEDCSAMWTRSLGVYGDGVHS